MGWFDEQIKQRKQNDDEMMQEAIAGIVGAVMGKRVAVAAAADDRRARTAIGDILRFYHIKADENSDTIKVFAASSRHHAENGEAGKGMV